MNSGDAEIFHVGTIKMLVHIALQNSQYDKAITLLDNSSRKISKKDFIELKIYKIFVLKNQGKNDKAKSLLEEIMLEKNLPRHLKQKSEELIGMM